MKQDFPIGSCFFLRDIWHQEFLLLFLLLKILSPALTGKHATKNANIKQSPADFQGILFFQFLFFTSTLFVVHNY